MSLSRKERAYQRMKVVLAGIRSTLVTPPAEVVAPPPAKKQRVDSSSSSSKPRLKHEKVCGHAQCTKKAQYGYEGVGARMCKQHQLTDMKNVRRPVCGCGNVPHFALEGQKPTHCSKCKRDGMVNVVSTKCACGREASFGVVGGRRTCCGKCRTANMVDLANKRCACGVQAIYGFVGKRPTHCVSCKLPTMVDLVNPYCLCGTRANYGLVGARRTCCSKCRTPDMVDLVNTYCPCNARAHFGVPGERPSSCSNCKTSEMIDLNHSTCSCGTRSTFGVPGSTASHCGMCKTEDMIDVVTLKCMHGRPLSECVGQACGVKLGGKSIQEIHVTAAVYLLKHHKAPEDVLESYLKCLNCRINLPDGRFMKPDMMPSPTEVVEFDGSYYHSDKYEDDTRKTAVLRDMHINVLRFRDTLDPIAGADNVHVNASCTVDQLIQQVFSWATVEMTTALKLQVRSLAERAILHLRDKSQKTLHDCAFTQK